MKAEYVDHMGSDLGVVNAARVSFDKVSDWSYQDSGVIGTLGYKIERVLSEADTKLINYLAKHDHWTPFAHTSISLRMKAPVPIRTQCFKHKQGLVENEESRRYIKTTPELFVPEVFRNAPVGNIKQGSGGEHYDSEFWVNSYCNLCSDMISQYEQMIADGVCPEQARFILPQGVMVNWVWTGNLYAFANFYKKRTDPHAQKEVQDLAKMVGEIIQPLFPVSWKALVQ